MILRMPRDVVEDKIQIPNMLAVIDVIGRAGTSSENLCFGSAYKLRGATPKFLGYSHVLR